MADTATATPPLNSMGEALATAAHAAARSPLERASEQAATTQQAGQQQRQVFNPNRPAVEHADHPNIDGDALQRARAADNERAGQTAAQHQAALDKVTQQKAGQQQAAAVTDTETDPSVASEPWKAHKKPKRGQADDWNALKANHAAELAALRKELDAAKGGAGATGDITKHPEFAKLKQQHDEYLDALKQVAVERDPAFQARFEPRREAVLGKIRQVAGAARDKVDAILKLPAGEFRDAAIEQALADFQPSTKATIMGQLQVLAMVDAERDAELATRKATYDTTQQAYATQQQQAAREREAKLTAALDKQIATWSDPEEGHPLFARRDGDDKWNKQVDKRIALARSIYSGESNPETLAQASLKAAAHDSWVTMALEATQEVERLTAALARYEGIQPGAGNLAASLMQSGSNDATAPAAADPFNPAYVQHFGAGLEEARRADYASGAKAMGG